MNCKCRRYRQCCFVYSQGAFRQQGCDKQRRRKANVYSYVFVHCAVLCVLDTSLFGQENIMREVYTSVAKETLYVPTENVPCMLYTCLLQQKGGGGGDEEAKTTPLCRLDTFLPQQKNALCIVVHFSV